MELNSIIYEEKRAKLNNLKKYKVVK